MKRSKEEIRENILKLCKNPTSVTQIVYQVNLNFRSVRPHVGVLVASGCLLEIPGNIVFYKTSGKGMEALQHIKALRELLKPG